VTRCPGADSCLSAITRPRGLADAIEALCRNGLSTLADLPLSIKISGCPNACGQHHIGDIGCFGVAVKVGGRPMPCYQLLLGGSTREGQAVFGKRFVRVPARKTPEAITRLVTAYHQDRKPEEPFGAFVGRVGLEALGRLLADLTEVDVSSSEPSLFMDLGATKPFELSISKGECGA
jgi:ferredoxin-nitrite reductase/sulfite reductase (ferredoxin)